MRTILSWVPFITPSIVLLVGCLLLMGCGSNFTPTDKTASYDPMTGTLMLPAPCPDWSQAQTNNVLNEPHSNFGCAVNSNAALQIEDPRDLYVGHGDNKPDTNVTVDVITNYRAGKIPIPTATTSTSTTGSASQ